MDRDEVKALLDHHKIHGSWCYGCFARVPKTHLIDVLFEDADYLLRAREV